METAYIQRDFVYISGSIYNSGYSGEQYHTRGNQNSPRVFLACFLLFFVLFYDSIRENYFLGAWKLFKNILPQYHTKAE